MVNVVDVVDNEIKGVVTVEMAVDIALLVLVRGGVIETLVVVELEVVKVVVSDTIPVVVVLLIKFDVVVADVVVEVTSSSGCFISKLMVSCSSQTVAVSFKYSWPLASI